MRMNQNFPLCVVERVTCETMWEGRNAVERAGQRFDGGELVCVRLDL